MLYSTALLALVASASVAIAAPDGCSENFSGHFTFTTQNVSDSSSSKVKRQSAICQKPQVTLQNGILTDQCDAQGEIVVNEQFQFDPKKMLQAGSKTSGFSVCSNGTLALDSTIFYNCLSGNFFNIYDASIGDQCHPVYIIVEACTPPSTPYTCASSLGMSATSGGSSESTSVASTSEASGPASVPATASTTPTSVITSAAPISTGTGKPASGANGTVSTAGSPSGSTAPEAFKGAASTLAIGQALVVFAAGVVGFALL